MKRNKIESNMLKINKLKINKLKSNRIKTHKIIIFIVTITILFSLTNIFANIKIYASNSEKYIVKEIIFTETVNIPVEKLTVLMPVKKGDKVEKDKIDKKCEILSKWFENTGEFSYVEVFYDLDEENKTITLYISLEYMPSFIYFIEFPESKSIAFSLFKRNSLNLGLTIGSDFPYEFLGSLFLYDLPVGKIILGAGYQKWENLDNVFKGLISVFSQLSSGININLFLNYIYFIDYSFYNYISTGFDLNIDKLYLKDIYKIGFYQEFYFEDSINNSDFKIISSRSVLKFKPFSFLEFTTKGVITNFYNNQFTDIINYFKNLRDSLKLVILSNNQSVIQFLNEIKILQFFNISLFQIIDLEISPFVFVDFVLYQNKIVNEINDFDGNYLNFYGAGIEINFFNFPFKIYYSYNYYSKKGSFLFGM